MGKRCKEVALTRGERNIEWVQSFCRVPEGTLVGQPVVLRSWQRDIIRGIYDSPTRRAIISFGRKNGKTALSAEDARHGSPSRDVAGDQDAPDAAEPVHGEVGGDGGSQCRGRPQAVAKRQVSRGDRKV